MKFSGVLVVPKKFIKNKDIFSSWEYVEDNVRPDFYVSGKFNEPLRGVKVKCR